MLLVCYPLPNTNSFVQFILLHTICKIVLFKGNSRNADINVWKNSWLLNHLNVLLQVPGASRFHLFIAAETFAQVSCANPKVGSGFYCITDLQNSSCVSGSIAIAFCTLTKKVVNIILFVLDFYQSSKSFRKAGDSHSCVIKHRRNCKANKKQVYKLWCIVITQCTMER